VKTKRYLSFTRHPEEKEVLENWWREFKNNPGDRAALRRCRSAAEVAFVPYFHQLRLDLVKIAYVQPQSLARVVGVLSHVKDYDESNARSIAQQMAAKKDGSDQARVSDLRFRRLLAIDDADELYGPMIRIIRLLGGGADIPSLADGIYWWNDRTKNTWAYDYYSEAPVKK
jgi:CRISPR system Cascade subunit CasB